jgi:glycosyltransferase involved in cell wall biosynthesis
VVSRPVADAFVDRYRVAAPVVAHNCHPWADRATLDGRTFQRRGRGLSLYWFSQTVGSNRGIQDAIRAAGHCSLPIEIHLQGSVADDVGRELNGLAEACGIGDALHFHEPVPPQELPSRAAEHDVGLAVETDEILNRRLAVTNKIFLYLVSGIAVAATDLPGQRSVMDTCPEAGALYRPGDVKALAARLDRWARDPDALEAAKHASLEAARTRWNWERESLAVVDIVERSVDRGTAAAAR